VKALGPVAAAVASSLVAEAALPERCEDIRLSDRDSGEVFRQRCGGSPPDSDEPSSRVVFTAASQEGVMLVLRGRADSLDADQAATESLVEHTAATEEPGLRVWTPHRHVAFGRRDASSDGYDRAVAAAESHGFPAVERDVGGRAVAFTGETLAFVLTEPVEDERTDIHDRYDRVLGNLRAALASLGVDARRGEPPDSFCPGSHSLQANGKIAGLAQRVTSDVTRVGGVLVVSDATAVSEVLEPVYAAIEVPFDPDSVGSIAGAGGSSDAAGVATTVEGTLVGDRPVTTRSVRET